MVNAIYAFIVFVLGLYARKFYGTLCLNLCKLVKGQIDLVFISPEDLKICQHLIKLTRLQAESQWEHISKIQHCKTVSHFDREVVK